MLNGMIAAVMSKLKFMRIRAQRAPDQLMTETDSKNRYAAFDQSAHGFDCIWQSCWVAWAVREKDSIGFQRQHFIGSCIRRDNGHVCTVTGEMAKDVFLYSKVVGDDTILGIRYSIIEYRIIVPFNPLLPF